MPGSGLTGCGYAPRIDQARRIIDNPDAHRYELWLGERLSGVVDYRDTGDGPITVLHVEVAPDLRGQGVSEPFFDDVLADIRRRSRTVTPVCGWARGQMRANPAHHDLLA